MQQKFYHESELPMILPPKVVAELLELSTGERAHQVLRNTVDRHDVRQVDFRGVGAGELDLGLLGSLFYRLRKAHAARR